MIILGSTGSIGVQALQIIKSQNLNIEVLCAGDNITLLNTQIAEFRPKIVVVKDSAKKDLVRGAKIVFCGDEGIIKALNIAESSFVLNALVGFSGVRPSLEAIRLGKTLALANKESLVVAGFLIDSADLARIIPVDSEHFALKELLDSAQGNSSLGMQFRTQSAESSVDSANHSPSYLPKSHISFAKRAAPPTPLPLRAKKLRFFAFRGRASLFPLLAKNRRLHFCNLESDFLHHEAGEFSGASHKLDLDSADSQNLNQNNLSLRADSQNLRGNPPIKKTQNLQGGLPRSHSLARNDKNIADSANQVKIAESALDSAPFTHIKKMIITASGGAFRDLPLKQIPRQRAESALKHPNWAMGRKITIDSASMINKVFEILEAKWLFGGRFCDCANFSQSAESSPNIDAVIERTSTLHALIQMQNNALLAHFSANDMRLPIASALLGDKAQNLAFVKELDLMDLNVRFEKIDCNRYPLWALKDEVLKRPKIGAIINAANDILVERFLQNQIYFGDISRGIFAVLDKFSAESMQNIDEILEINAKIKDFLSRFKGFRH